MKIQRSIIVTSAILVLVILPPSVNADEILHEDSGLEFTIPSTWGHYQDEGLLTTNSPDGDILMFLYPSELQVVTYLSDAIKEEISRTIQHPEVLVEAELAEINELIQFRAEGIGLFEDRIVDWTLSFVAGGRKSMLFIVVGDLENNREIIEEVFSTIHLTEPIEVPEEFEEQAGPH